MRYLVSKQIKPVLGSSSLETATGILYSFTQKLSKNLASSPENRHSSQTKLDEPSRRTMSGESSPAARGLRGAEGDQEGLDRVGSDLKQPAGAGDKRA